MLSDEVRAQDLPRIAKANLYDQLFRDLESAGAVVLNLSKSSSSPQTLRVEYNGERRFVRIYLWQLTPDKTRDDYKFQLTGVRGRRFLFDPVAKTVILGLYPSLDLYLAADAGRRRGVFGKSPAVQVRQKQLDEANDDGLASFEKERTRETALVIRGDLLPFYLTHSEEMHRVAVGSSWKSIRRDIVSAIDETEPTPVELTPRRRESRALVAVARDAGFARRVLRAYGNCCAVCGTQLRLIDAAHIVPAGHLLSSDDTRNGLALCVVHHRAYDSALVVVDPEYAVTVNEERIRHLEASRLAAGASEFRRGIRPRLLLPRAQALHPDPRCLQIGMELRKVPRVK